MSEKILVDRDLMKRLFDIIAGDGFHEELEVDKLLSATPNIKAGRLALDSYSDRYVSELSERNEALEFQASHNYEVAQLLLAQCDQLRDELYELKAGQGEAVAWLPVDRKSGERWPPVHCKGSGSICDYIPLYISPASLNVSGWRDHSVNYARGEKCPATIETLQAAWDRDQELMLDQKAEISRLKETVNQLRQKRTTPPSTGVIVPSAHADVLAERRRQVEKEGCTPEHDDAHSDGALAKAAACYAANAGEPRIPKTWPWQARFWKPGTTRRMLVKSGALILAEIERIDRAAAQVKP